MTTLIPLEHIERHIFVIRGQKIMLDTDLARLYGIQVGALIRQVKRNNNRFPDDFCFQLTWDEDTALKCQIGISKTMRGGRRFLPYAFAEPGIAMLSSVLKSERAAIVNVAIMRTFVKLREVLSTHKHLAKKLEELELSVQKHDRKFKKQAIQIKQIFDAIWVIMNQPKEKIGF